MLFECNLLANEKLLPQPLLLLFAGNVGVAALTIIDKAAVVAYFVRVLAQFVEDVIARCNISN